MRNRRRRGLNQRSALGHRLRRNLAILMLLVPAAAVERPRVFITESQAAQVTGEAAVGQATGTLSFSGGTSPSNVQVMKVFQQQCPVVVITANREKADYVIRLDHEAVGPTTPFMRGNKVAVFDKNEDLIYANTTKLLSNAVKDACTVVLRRQGS
jgi:hypothetical protein